MCGRFALTHITGFWSRFAVIDRHAVLEPRFNIAPSQMAPIVMSSSPNSAVMMKWGLVPSWAKDPRIGNKLINARAETVAAKPAFGSSFKRRRCLIPATGFYEWRRLKDGKVPHYIHKMDDSLFAFAGLYDKWTMPDGNLLHSFTIITTDANKIMEKIHSRMPVILKQGDEELWLSKEQLGETDQKRLLVPYPLPDLEAYEVSTEVNSPANDFGALIEPV